MVWLGLIVLGIGLFAVQGDASGHGVDDETSSGKGDTGDMEEGSAYEPEQSDCQKLRDKMQLHAVIAYIPQCQDDGNFEKKQCHIKECWCVDIKGAEISGTRMKDSEFVQNCDNPQINSSPQSPKSLLPEAEKGLKTVTPTEPEAAEEDEMPESSSDVTSTVGQATSTTSLPVFSGSVMGQPGILVGIVGGAVVGLLGAVLFVMFIVYRMRKKDEGSYALEEQKQSSGYRYHQANTKEFYA